MTKDSNQSSGNHEVVPFSVPVTPKEQLPADFTEEKYIESIDRAEQKAKTDRTKAETGDIKANTWLKIGLSVFIAILMLSVLVFEVCTVKDYTNALYEAGKDIPESIILAVLGTSSSVFALMGFILKGLFKTN